VTKAILDPATGFKIGLFSSNCSGGLAVTKIPERWSASWEDNLALAQLSDRVGIDFLLPIARWIGYGGDTNFHGGVLDPVVLAGGQLAVTERLTVFSTIHTAFNHPLVAAKEIATLDQIGPGRAGLNVVAGWNKPEYDAMGIDLPTDHDSRYAMAQEWFEIVSRIWREPGSFDHEGEFFSLQGVEGEPKPQDGSVPILNAGSSPQGIEYAGRNADFLFTIVSEPAPEGQGKVAEIEALAKDRHGREIGVFTPCHVVCRETKAEAEEFLHYYADENADWDAVDNLMALQGLHAQSFTAEMLELFRGRFAAGHGTLPLIGTPDEVAALLIALSEAGFDGCTVSFVDYLGELPYFADEVIPRLEHAGVRAPRPALS
jgi:dimethylsulfone monooxygenase